ncbi:hypothetical protein V4V57_003097 [Vibrio mimicus]
MEVIAVTLDGGRTVYMSTSSKNSEYDTVVKVCPNKFRMYWQREPYPLEPNLVFGGEREWRQDYKFGQAERGFSFGKTNPVPLPRLVATSKVETVPIKDTGFLFRKVIGHKEVEQLHYVGLDNGITRTIWLLANSAEFIPVLCNKKQADILKQFAGFEEK